MQNKLQKQFLTHITIYLLTFMHWRRKRQPTPVFLPRESQGQRSLVGCHLWAHRVGHNWRDLAAAAELFIFPSLHSPTGLLTQQKYPIEWIYTHFRGTRSLTPYLDLIALIIINGRNRTKTLIGSNPHKIVLPINKAQFENTLQTSTDFQ